MSEARGSYIVFVDSDDWVEDYYLEYLRNSLDTNEPGLVVGGFFRESRNNVTDGVENPLTFYSEDFHLMIRRMQMHRQSFPFGKIFKTSIIKEHHLRFEEGVHFGEDLIFVYNYLCHISYVKFIGCCGYHYITHKNSLAMSYGSYECELKGFNAYKTVTLRLQEQYQISKDELVYSNNNLANFLLRAVKVMYRPGKNHLPLSDRLHHLREDIASDDIELLEAYSEHCDGINKIVCQCILHQKIIKLDVILSSFFFCRYSAPARILIRIIRYL